MKTPRRRAGVDPRCEVQLDQDKLAEVVSDVEIEFE